MQELLKTLIKQGITKITAAFIDEQVVYILLFLNFLFIQDNVVKKLISNFNNSISKQDR